MKKIHWLVMVGLAMGVTACGDDDDTSGCPTTADGTCAPGCGGIDPDCETGEVDGGTDSGGGTMNADCPTGDSIPDEEGFMGACCWRVSNAERSEAPEFRVSGLRITSPQSLGNPLVRGALNGALDDERFNWLIKADISGGEATITTGFGQRNSDATFSFTDNAAPTPGPADRWNPLTTTGSIDGETLSAPPLTMTFTVPIFDEDGESLVIELPLNGFELVSATLSENRSCIGLRTGSAYDTTQGEIQTYITIESAMAGRVEIPPINTTLCNFIAGMGSNMGACTDVPQGEWAVPPDAICTEGVCNTDCSPEENCNAWTVGGQFAAHGVEITD